MCVNITFLCVPENMGMYMYIQCIWAYTCMYTTLITMWYQRVCNCRHTEQVVLYKCLFRPRQALVQNKLLRMSAVAYSLVPHGD